MKKIAKLTAEEKKAWEKYFAYYVDDEGFSDIDADAATWRDMQNEFPRLRNYEGCE